ncbi:MAG: rod shape-determining protein RodA [Actinomycetes bacterium]
MSVGYRPTPYTVPPPRRSSRLLHRDSAIRRLDWTLLLAVLALLAIGCALVWSATRQSLLDSGGDPQAFLKKHVLNIVIGLTLAMVASLCDYRMLRAYAPVLYVLSIAGLVAVITPLGSTINGSHSWIVLPAGFSVQPSEFAKVALVVGMSMLLAEKRDAEEDPRDLDVLLALAFAGLPLLLVMLQPDLGTALVVSALVLGMIAVSGAPIRWVLGLVAGGVLVAVVAIQVGVLKAYQLDRFRAFYDPTADPKGAGYNVRQAQIAIGSGSLHGEGLLHGAQTQGKFVPAQQTDFIFTVAGEELGFIGAAGIVVLLGIILWRISRIAMGAEDLFGRLVATGVLCWFAFQAFENIGMTLGIMPVTGVPLPFVSYGGSSMFANLLAIGLLQNVHMRRYT